MCINYNGSLQLFMVITRLHIATLLQYIKTLVATSFDANISMTCQYLLIAKVLQLVLTKMSLFFMVSLIINKSIKNFYVNIVTPIFIY